MKQLSKQKGVALVISLVLLLVASILAMSIARTVNIQESMSGNERDRDIAFQNAESALRVATAALQNSTAVIWRDCSASNSLCEADPSGDATSVGAWQTVQAGDYKANSLAVGQPEYVVEKMGVGQGSASNGGSLSLSASGDCGQYGSACTGSSSNEPYYRITAISGPPSNVQGRAVVILQAWVKG